MTVNGVPVRKLGSQGLQASIQGLGCMGMSQSYKPLPGMPLANTSNTQLPYNILAMTLMWLSCTRDKNHCQMVTSATICSSSAAVLL